MKLSAYAKKIGLCYRSAWNHFHKGLIPGAYRLPSGAIIVPDGISDTHTQDMGVCIYSRVSSSKNRDNLDSQSQRLEQYCIAKGWKIKRIVKEVASGINDKRALLSNVIRNIHEYDRIVVEHKDRLTRFGFNYFMDFHPDKFHVVNETEDKTDDLVGDLVSIVTSFCARLYGQRRGKRKTEKIIKELKR